MTGSIGPSAIASGVHTTLDDAFRAIPAGDTHAIILDGTYAKEDGPAGRVLFVQRVEHGWNVAIGAGYDKPHGASATAEVLRSW